MSTDATRQPLSVDNVDPAYIRGKRVLLFVARFFYMSRHIREALERLGATVDLYDERPANSLIAKTLIRLRPALMARRINRYFDNIARSTATARYDYIVVIKGECIPAAAIRRLRELHPEATAVLYEWDPVAILPNFNKIRGCFDKVLSFEPDDCRQYGLQFLPLFYSGIYAEAAAGKQKFDLLFVGTVHSERYRFLRSVVAQVKAMGGSVLTYLYFPHRLLYLRKKYLLGELPGASIRHFRFHPLDDVRLARLYGSCRMTVDLQRPGQGGLTIRSIETLGARRKMITTNPQVRRYDFYRPENILVVDRDNPEITRRFFDAPYVEIPQEVYRAYSLDNWLANLLLPPTTQSSSQ